MADDAGGARVHELVRDGHPFPRVVAIVAPEDIHLHLLFTDFHAALGVPFLDRERSAVFQHLAERRLIAGERTGYADLERRGVRSRAQENGGCENGQDGKQLVAHDGSPSESWMK